MKPEDDGLDLRPFDWEKLFRRLFVIGLALWVLSGAISAILIGYFADELVSSSSLSLSTLFVTDSETATKVAVTIHKLAFTVHTISFLVWVASGVLLVYLWFRARTSHVEPPTPN